MAEERLETFLGNLRDEAKRASAQYPELAEDDLFRFAVGDLLPSRIDMACMFLADLDDGDAQHLDQYLDGIEAAVAGEIAAATAGAAVADSVLGAAEDLHAYLLGHELVDHRYSRLQSFRSTLRREEPRQVFFPSVASWEDADRVPLASVDAHEYALAA